jgi:hypothetical protein
MPRHSSGGESPASHRGGSGSNPGLSGHVGFCDGQKWRWDRFSARTSVSPANLHPICFSTIIFTITRGWHNRPGVTALPIASQTRIKEKGYVRQKNYVTPNLNLTFPFHLLALYFYRTEDRMIVKFPSDPVHWNIAWRRN